MTDSIEKRTPLSEDKREARRTLLSGMYSAMVRIRLFEERVAELVEAGEVRTPCHLYIGQEAVAVGVCSALERQDYIWGAHRSHGHYLAKGGDVGAMMAEIFGKKTGCSSGRGGSMHVAAPELGLLGTVPLVAATIPLAVGAGLASRLRRDHRVSVSFFGDGATEEGHFYESLGLARLYMLPVIFLCENNLYASHMHISERRAAPELLPLAEAHGMTARQIDGNDVVAVYDAMTSAVERARNGGGPTFIECLTYRWRGHVGPSWDMDVGVKRKDDLANWLERDPLSKVRAALAELGVGREYTEGMDRKIRNEIDDAVAFARMSPYPERHDLRDYVFMTKE
jgi:pyruvate dehydrogenase E1 component alpha subunit